MIAVTCLPKVNTQVETNSSRGTLHWKVVSDVNKKSSAPAPPNTVSMTRKGISSFFCSPNSLR